MVCTLLGVGLPRAKVIEKASLTKSPTVQAVGTRYHSLTSLGTRNIEPQSQKMDGHMDREGSQSPKLQALDPVGLIRP